MAGMTTPVIGRLPVTAAIRKGPNLTGIDPSTGNIIPLFHPRRKRWLDHCRFHGPMIEGVTAIGRTTIKLLSMNDVDYPTGIRITTMGSEG